MDCRPKKMAVAREVAVSEGLTVLGTTQVKTSR